MDLHYAYVSNECYLAASPSPDRLKVPAAIESGSQVPEGLSTIRKLMAPSPRTISYSSTEDGGCYAMNDDEGLCFLLLPTSKVEDSLASRLNPNESLLDALKSQNSYEVMLYLQETQFAHRLNYEKVLE